MRFRRHAVLVSALAALALPARDAGAQRSSAEAPIDDGVSAAPLGPPQADILLTMGASFAAGSIVRLGAEYVVQDLEGAWEPDEADGGIRHFVGPTASLQLARRVQLAAGPAFGLSQGSPEVLGRLAAIYAF